jgi:hypothetical protein
VIPNDQHAVDRASQTQLLESTEAVGTAVENAKTIHKLQEWWRRG